jgi:hypothetical protein
MPTTSISINTRDRRDVEALKIFQGARSWAKCVIQVPGVGAVKAYGVPSRSDPNRYHYTNLSQCSCEDFQYRQGRQDDGTYFRCAHQRAVAWYVDYVRAERRKEALLAAEEASRRAKAEADYQVGQELDLVDAF